LGSVKNSKISTKSLHKNYFSFIGEVFNYFLLKLILKIKDFKNKIIEIFELGFGFGYWV
jgi:hypothetical protein